MNQLAQQHAYRHGRERCGDHRSPGVIAIDETANEWIARVLPVSMTSSEHVQIVSEQRQLPCLEAWLKALPAYLRARFTDLDP